MQWLPNLASFPAEGCLFSKQPGSGILQMICQPLAVSPHAKQLLRHLGRIRGCIPSNLTLDSMPLRSKLQPPLSLPIACTWASQILMSLSWQAYLVKFLDASQCAKSCDIILQPCYSKVCLNHYWASDPFSEVQRAYQDIQSRTLISIESWQLCKSA